MARYRNNPNYPFWQTLKQGYDYFERYRLPPAIAVCDHRYVVNVKASPNTLVHPDAACPRFTRPVVAPFVPKPSEQQLAEERIVVPGPKLREMQDFAAAKPAPAQPDAAFATSYGLGVSESTGSTTAPQ